MVSARQVGPTATNSQTNVALSWLVPEEVRMYLEQFLVLAMAQVAAPALPNHNDEEAAGDEKGPENLFNSQVLNRQSRAFAKH